MILACWAWLQSAQGSSQLGKTVKMGTFIGLAAILTIIYRLYVNMKFFHNPHNPN